MKVPSDGWQDEERDLPEDLADELSKMDGAAALPIDALRAAGTGVLPDDLEKAAQAYLTKDPQAKALVDELNETASLDAHGEARLYARISQQSDTGVAWRTASRRPWQVAAAIATLAIAGTLWFVTSRDGGDVPTVAVTQAPSVPATQPPAPVTKPETFLLPLERPDVRVSLRALTWRGSERTNPVLSALRPALDAFRAGDYRLADREFSTVNERYPNLVEVALYQGISLLFLGDIAGATASLHAAEKINDDAFKNDVAWYLAIAEERGGNLDAARARLNALCADGSGDARACTALKQP